MTRRPSGLPGLPRQQGRIRPAVVTSAASFSVLAIANSAT